MTSNAGRPREYRNAAEKQRAYRERQKADFERIELGEYMLGLLEEQAQALRNSVDYWSKKGERLDIVLTPSTHWVQITKGGYFNSNLQEIVFQYLHRRGELVATGKLPFGDIVYRLKGYES